MEAQRIDPPDKTGESALVSRELGNPPDNPKELALTIRALAAAVPNRRIIVASVFLAASASLFAQPAIEGVTVNYATNSLSIAGRQLQGVHSYGVYSVQVANTQLAVVESSNTSITANFPPSAPVANFFVGSYLLTVNFLNGSVLDTSPSGTATFQLAALGRRQTTNLQFTFAYSGGGTDTALEISNTSKDGVGSPQISGTCALAFYGAGAPSSNYVTASFSPGLTNSFSVSSLAPGFVGYIIATCGFPASGMALVTAGSTVVVTPVVVLNQ
jgi:hypothetical protein